MVAMLVFTLDRALNNLGIGLVLLFWSKYREFIPFPTGTPDTWSEDSHIKDVDCLYQYWKTASDIRFSMPRQRESILRGHGTLFIVPSLDISRTRTFMDATSVAAR